MGAYTVGVNKKRRAVHRGRALPFIMRDVMNQLVVLSG
ncbi:hypothetical protein BAT_3884 [Bacillus pumilus ATCC 7061]|nr:hypothetical protein BAT_3884 [Bacillus pumilus ATCC 7061]